MRVVFLGSPPFATPVFASLVASARHSAIALVTRPDKPRGRGMHVATSPLVELARANSIPVLQPERARGPEFLAALRQLAPDALLVASYGEILRQDVLDVAPHGAFNVHASLLPRHRGASPIQAAILAGDEETGVAVQRMVLALDEGDIVHEERTRIGPHENAGELLARLADLGAIAALRALDSIEAGTVKPRPQDPALATYARRILKEEGAIDWTLDAAAIDRHVRAHTPWPGARTTGPAAAELTLLDVVPSPDHVHAAPPGTLLAVNPALLVACGRGALEIRALKPAGKGRMDALAWLRGARLEVGARFGSAP
ncbi:MAG: methionyl-tRNA formyltransferase [Planctomycetota bacterium]|nr:methionyl-tRNA formyltransferase [Planctomycetota bacterium]